MAPRTKSSAAGVRGVRRCPVAADGEVAWSREGAIARIALGRPGASPRLGARSHAALCAAAHEIDHDEEIRVVLVESLGRDFCGGATSEAPAADPSPDGVTALSGLRVPVVALLRGLVLDEGLEIALACDLRVASRDAVLGLTQVGRGGLPAHGGTQRLPRLVGRARALRMLLLSERVAAPVALAWGLVDEVAAPGRLPAAGRALAGRLAARGPIAQRFAKEALGAALDLPLTEGLRLEGDLYVLLQTTRDREEGLASFRERRPPVYLGK